MYFFCTNQSQKKTVSTRKKKKKEHKKKQKKTKKNEKMEKNKAYENQILANITDRECRGKYDDNKKSE